MTPLCDSRSDDPAACVEEKTLDPLAQIAQAAANVVEQSAHGLPVVHQDEAADALPRAVGIGNGHGDRQHLARQTGRALRPGNNLASVEQHRRHQGAGIPPEPFAAARRDGTPLCIDAENDAIRRMTGTDGGEKTRYPLVEIADDEIAHEILTRPRPGVPPRSIDRDAHSGSALLGDLMQLNSHLALDGGARAREGDDREDAAGNDDQRDRKKQKLGAQRQVIPRLRDPSGVLPGGGVAVDRHLQSLRRSDGSSAFTCRM